LSPPALAVIARVPTEPVRVTGREPVAIALYTYSGTTMLWSVITVEGARGGSCRIVGVPEPSSM
jgi:hypothetical protein